MAGAVAWLTLAGAIISLAPLAVGLVAAAGAGALNAAAVRATTAAAAPSRRRRRLPVPLAVLATFGIAIGGAAGAFAAVPGPVSSAYQEVLPTVASGRPVLEMAGFGSRWAPPSPLGLPPGFTSYRYSYCGVGPRGRVCPYRPRDTEQSLSRSTALLGQQVAALRQAYRRPVDIVAESEGAMIAQSWLVHGYRPASGEVGRVVLLDLPQGQPYATYPPGGSQGWGVGSGRLLSGWVWLIHQVSPLDVSVHAPLFRDFTTVSGLARARAPRSVPEIVIDALADALDDPYPSAFPGDPTIVLPAAHGGLMENGRAHATIRAFLDGRPVATGHAGVMLDRVIGAASAAWQAPSSP